MDRCGLAGAGSHGSTVDCMDGDWSTVAYFGCGQEGESNQRRAEGENAAAARDESMNGASNGSEEVKRSGAASMVPRWRLCACWEGERHHLLLQPPSLHVTSVLRAHVEGYGPLVHHLTGLEGQICI